MTRQPYNFTISAKVWAESKRQAELFLQDIMKEDTKIGNRDLIEDPHIMVEEMPLFYRMIYKCTHCKSEYRDPQVYCWVEDENAGDPFDHYRPVRKAEEESHPWESTMCHGMPDIDIMDLPKKVNSTLSDIRKLSNEDQVLKVEQAERWLRHQLSKELTLRNERK